MIFGTLLFEALEFEKLSKQIIFVAL